MAVEDWIDRVVTAMGKIPSHTRGTVRVFRVAGKAEIPDALSSYPCAVIYAPRLISAQYSASISKEIWEVKGLFFIFSDTKKSNIPELVRYFKKIRTATLSNSTLGGAVDHFVFADDPMSLGELTYEVDTPGRHGIEVTWHVKADVTNEVVISG